MNIQEQVEMKRKLIALLQNTTMRKHDLALLLNVGYPTVLRLLDLTCPDKWQKRTVKKIGTFLYRYEGKYGPL